MTSDPMTAQAMSQILRIIQTRPIFYFLQFNLPQTSILLKITYALCIHLFCKCLVNIYSVQHPSLKNVQWTAIAYLIKSKLFGFALEVPKKIYIFNLISSCSLRWTVDSRLTATPWMSFIVCASAFLFILLHPLEMVGPTLPFYLVTPFSSL